MTRWAVWGGLLFGLIALLEIYQVALNGPFLFDDVYLPFLVPNFASNPFLAWIVGVRPTLQATYWLNYKLFGLDPYPYHLLNLLLHIVAGFFVWLIARKLLSFLPVEGKLDRIFAALATGVFLLHPLQTESVSYVASRSEVLSGFFLLIAWAAFLYRGSEGIGWGSSALVLLFFGLAITSKEHAAVLPAVLLLTDYFFNPGFSLAGMKKNWRLYVPIFAGAALGVVVIFKVVLSRSTSAGFGMKGLTPLDYLFTQFRVLVTYLRLYFLPVDQNVDYDYAISHSLMDQGSWFCLLLLLGITVAAWIYRKQYPLAAFGWFLFLVLLAPTSSIVPIQDVIVERRMYLPLFALTLCIIDILRVKRVSMGNVALGTVLVCLLLAVVTWQRNQVWASAVDLWKDAVKGSPMKYRPRFQLAYAHYEKGECLEATNQYREAAKLTKPTYELYIDWALAADCASRPGEALTRLEDAIKIEDTAHAWALLGMVRGKQNDWDRALAALAEAEKRNPAFSTIYVYRGNIHAARREWDLAIAAYEKAIALEPNERSFQQNLQKAQLGKQREERRKAAKK